MRQAKVYTRPLNFEAKQYKIMKFDLGDGVNRSTIVLAMILYVFWLPIALYLFGSPTDGVGFSLILLPPAFISLWGTKENIKYPTHKNITVLGVKLGFLFLSKPTTNLGRSRSLYKLSFSQKQNKTAYTPFTPKVIKIRQQPRIYTKKTRTKTV